MPQQPFGLRFGKPETDSIVVVVQSLVTGSVTITANGADTVIALTASEVIGTDGGTLAQAGYVNNAVISGLDPYTKYTYTATQNGSTISGYFWTAPELLDDFILIPITCDLNSDDSGYGDPAGGYTQAKTIAEANPDKGVYFVHMDDHYGYMDGSPIDDTAGTGHACTAANASASGKVYDYCLGALAAHGLFSTLGNAYCTWGHNEDRLWCMRNIPVLTGKGDHDSGANDMGMIHLPTDATGTPSPKTQFDNSKIVWDAFLAPLQGTGISAGTNAWEHTLGCIKIVAPDGITKGSGDAEAVNAWDKATTIYGTTQIDDIIAAMDDSSVPFKILSMANGIRYTVDNVGTGPTRYSSGSQYPIAGNEGFSAPIPAHAEYKRLMTNAGGLMTKPSCNGQFGTMLSVHGDYHMAKVMKNTNTTGTNAEWFYSISVATINGSANFTANTPEGTTVDGSLLEMKDQGAQADWWVVPMYVYGSRRNKEIEVEFFDKNGLMLWNKKFIHGRGGNDAHAVDADLSLKLSIEADTE